MIPLKSCKFKEREFAVTVRTSFPRRRESSRGERPFALTWIAPTKSVRHSRAGGNPEIKSGFRSSIRRSWQTRFHFLTCFRGCSAHGQQTRHFCALKASWRCFETFSHVAPTASGDRSCGLRVVRSRPGGTPCAYGLQPGHFSLVTPV